MHAFSGTIKDDLERIRNHGMKILVLDDEPIQVESICRGLFLLGYECVGKTSSKEALGILDQADHGQIDLVMTDLTMPGTSGFDLIEHLRTSHPEIPIIVITGLTPNTEIDQVRKQGIPILQKPFDPDALDQAILALYK